MKVQTKYAAVIDDLSLIMGGRYKTTGYSKSIPNIAGSSHYIIHPGTKNLVEDLGAVPAMNKFPELKPGQKVLFLDVFKPYFTVWSFVRE